MASYRHDPMMHPAQSCEGARGGEGGGGGGGGRTGGGVVGQVAGSCQAAGGVALLLIRDSAVNAPSAIPVFVISTANGDFLRNTVGYNTTTGVSNYPIRIN